MTKLKTVIIEDEDKSLVVLKYRYRTTPRPTGRNNRDF
jgi:hypothetical protein